MKTHRSNSSSQTRKDTSSVENSKSKVAVGAASQGRSQREDGCSDGQTTLATNKMTEAVGEKGTEEGAGDEERDDVFADNVSLGGRFVGEVELGLERVETDGRANEGARVANHAGST